MNKNIVRDIILEKKNIIRIFLSLILIQYESNISYINKYF